MQIAPSSALLFALILPFAEGQSTGAKTTPTKQGSPAERHYPVVKCADQDTLKSCNSLKELIRARDGRLLNEILGSKVANGTHVSYICLRPKIDAFSVVSFDIPSPKAYHPPMPLEIPGTEDDSVPGNRELRASQQSVRELIEDGVFTDLSDKTAVSRATKEQWFRDHSKGFPCILLASSLTFVTKMVWTQARSMIKGSGLGSPTNLAEMTKPPTRGSQGDSHGLNALTFDVGVTKPEMTIPSMDTSASTPRRYISITSTGTKLTLSSTTILRSTV